MRETIFIGHAMPEDNEYTLWLYYKLRNEGYKVECDLSFLIGGESDYWARLQEVLENETCKYILVLTKNTFTKEGVLDEWEHCKSIAKKNSLRDFRIPVRFDEVDYDQRIGLNRINIIDFSQSWPQGLKKLLTKLRRDKIHKPEATELSLTLWYQNKFTTASGVIPREEKLYSNWLELPELPEILFFHEFGNTADAETVFALNDGYPVIRHGNYLITFCQGMKLEIETDSLLKVQVIEPRRTFQMETAKATSRYESEEFPKFKELQNFLKRLLKEAIFRFMSQRGLKYFVLSGERRCFYYEKEQLTDDKVFFNYEGKRTWKQMVGDHRGFVWHYGISFKPITYPFVGFALKAHILFSDDGKKIWEDQKKQHRYRRGKGANMFNQHWRNQLLGFLHSLSDENGKIVLQFNHSSAIAIQTTPIMFFSKYGYDDPRDNARLIPLNHCDEVDSEEEELADAEEETDEIE